MKRILFLFSVLLAFTAPCFAQDAAVPDIVTKGFDAYAKNGSKAAFDAWLDGSPLNLDTATRQAFDTGFQKIEGAYGKYTGYEVIRVVQLSPSVRIVYAVAKFQLGPLWMAFDCYKPADKWMLPTLNMDTNPAKVLPPDILGGSTPPSPAKPAGP